MKRFLVTAVLSFLSILPCLAAVKPAVDKAHRASYHIGQAVVTNKEGELCSATAIGPQALLTASHCEMPTNDITVAGPFDDKDTVEEVFIAARLRDNFDHTIYLIKGRTFPVFVDLATEEPLDVAEDLFTFGNPGDWTDVFQRGYVAGFDVDADTHAPYALLDLQAFGGTSGSGVFDEEGKLVAVISFTAIQEKSGISICFAGAYPVQFSKEDFEKARKFSTPPPAPIKK